MSRFRTIFLGFVVGAGMSIPGFSGGTLAILLGVYRRLLSSVDNIIKDFKGSAPFLTMFAVGGAAGFFTAARLISRLLDSAAAVPLRFAFLGAAAAAVIPVLKEAKALPLRLPKLVLILIGVLSAWLITMIPQITLTEGHLTALLLQLVGGIILAAALVLPGISASQMLVTLGLYEQVLSSVSEGALLQLIPLGIGCVLGVLLTAKVMTNLMERFSGTYLVILGFVLFSVTELIPKTQSLMQILIGLVCSAIGFTLTYLCIGSEKKFQKNTQND